MKTTTDDCDEGHEIAIGIKEPSSEDDDDDDFDFVGFDWIVGTF